MARPDVPIAAHFFDGAPFTIDIASFEAVASGGTAKIIVGNMVHNNDSWVVAVKVFKTVLDDNEKMLLHRELKIARQVSRRHPFIAPFIGTADIGLETSIVSLYMEKGNLLDYLKANKGIDRKKLILQVAEAVDFLHSDQGLVHGDLKCANVLISDFGDALLADFGLSTFVEKAKSSATTAIGIRAMYTVRFAAPELLQDSAGHPRRRSKTRETDIWAFGMLILEALTEQAPWAELNEFAVMHYVHSGKLPPRPTAKDGFVSISHAWWDICNRCWAYEPRTRPTMKTVMDSLRLYSALPGEILQQHFLTVSELPGAQLIEPFCESEAITSEEHLMTFTYMPCGQRIAVGTWIYDQRESDYLTTVAIYDIASGQTVAGPMMKFSHLLNRLAVSPDGRRIIAATDYEVIWWDATSGELWDQSVPTPQDISAFLTFTPDAECVASRTHDRQSIYFWNTTTGERVGEPLIGHTGSVEDLVFSSTGTHVVTLSYTNGLLLWQFRTGKLLAAAPVPCQSCVCFFPNGEHVVAGSEDGIIRIWSTSSLQLEHTLDSLCVEDPEHESPYIRQVAVSPSGRYIASASDYRITIWETETGRPFARPLVCPLEFVNRLEFSPDGKTLVASNGGFILVWDLFE